MRIDIRWKGTKRTEALVQHIRRRAGFALGRLADRIRRVEVRLEDVNGPRGGVDKRCRVEVAGPFGSRIVEVHDSDFRAAVDRAMETARRTVVRNLQRPLSRRTATLRTNFDEESAA